MPGKPSLKSEDRGGHIVETALFAVDKATAGANLVFMVKYEARSGAPGPDAPALLEAVVKAMSSGNKLVSDENEAIGGFPAREFVMQDAEDSYQVRAVLTDRYFIEVMFLGPTGQRARRTVSGVVQRSGRKAAARRRDRELRYLSPRAGRGRVSEANEGEGAPPRF